MVKFVGTKLDLYNVSEVFMITKYRRPIEYVNIFLSV